MSTRHFPNNNFDELEQLTRKLRQELKLPAIILLNGQLGAGKTTFIQHLTKELGIQNRVNSPTFTKINEYQSENLLVYHLDLYKQLPDPEEIEEILEVNEALICIEWANNLKEHKDLSKIFDLKDRQIISMNFLQKKISENNFERTIEIDIQN
ncbi:MAG: tRNA (adenosine(37)-N6)-threonylcarbamoyltransferase complex ATPase subunit type 1 TsaE [Candidatus Caenarcaniphilales bacterium]|nr:tRNA (adenosine(37)-N6)-threonylcarbamoyltransferase complex ATPase subunit type 1 TsaE [Candidatus Caenarcaniphilales bacterium]